MNSRKLVSAVVVGGVLSTGALFAQESPSNQVDLEPVVLTGKEKPEEVPALPQSPLAIDSEFIDVTQASDLEDLFQTMPAVRVGGGLSAAQKIYVRGLEDKLLNISIDGATQAGYLTHHQSQFLIDPDLLKVVEVDPGAGKATSGPGALGGAIRFENKGASDFLREGQDWGAYLKSGFHSRAEAFSQNVTGYGMATDKVGILASFSFMEANDYEDGNGNPVTFTAHQQRRGFVKVDAAITDSQSVGFSYERVEDSGIYRHRPNFNGFFNHPVAPNKPVANETDRDTATFSYHANPEDNDYVDVEAEVFYTNFRITREGQYKIGTESIGFDLRNTSKISDHSLTYGVDYRHDTTKFEGGGFTKGFLPFNLVYNSTPDEHLNIFGVYLQNDWQIIEPLTLSFGVRFDHYDFEDFQGQEFQNSGASPNVELTYEIIEPLEVYAGFAQAFRGVTSIDSITRAEGGTVNAAAIDREKADNFEGGVRFDNETIYANGAFYHQRIRDIIASNGGPRTNVGNLETWGYEFSVGGRYQGFNAGIGVGKAHPTLNGTPLNDTSFGLGSAYGRTWNGNVGYTFEELRLSLGWLVEFVEEFDDVPAGIPTKDSYFVHDIYASWHPLKDQDLAIQLSVNNLFDKYYVDQATSGFNTQLGRVAGLPEPGRDVRLAVSYQF